MCGRSEEDYILFPSILDTVSSQCCEAAFYPSNRHGRTRQRCSVSITSSMSRDELTPGPSQARAGPDTEYGKTKPSQRHYLICSPSAQYPLSTPRPCFRFSSSDNITMPRPTKAKQQAARHFTFGLSWPNSNIQPQEAMPERPQSVPEKVPCSSWHVEGSPELPEQPEETRQTLPRLERCTANAKNDLKANMEVDEGTALICRWVRSCKKTISSVSGDVRGFFRRSSYGIMNK